jgi:hypothetical protein
LTPTSRTLVAVADRLVALGGGPIAQTELHAARRAGVATLAHTATPARP